MRGDDIFSNICLGIDCGGLARGGLHTNTYCFKANEDPQPQADSEFGLLLTTNDERIISSTKSIVEPRTNSKEPSSTTTAAPSRSKRGPSAAGAAAGEDK